MGEIQDELKKISGLLEEKERKKEKKFKIPFGARVSPRKARKNWVTIMRLNENGHADFKKVQITEQTFMEEGIPRLAAAGYVLYFKKNPLIILPSWSVEPFSAMEHYNQSLINGSNTKGYSILMSRMKTETINPKKGVSGAVKWIVLLILGAIIGYALLTGGS